MPHDELLDFCYVVGMVVGCPRQRAAMDHIFRESHVVGTRQSTCLKLCLSCYPYPVLMRHRQGLSCLQSLSAGIRFQLKTSGSRYLYQYLVGSISRFKRIGMHRHDNALFHYILFYKYMGICMIRE